MTRLLFSPSSAMLAGNSVRRCTHCQQRVVGVKHCIGHILGQISHRQLVTEAKVQVNRPQLLHVIYRVNEGHEVDGDVTDDCVILTCLGYLHCGLVQLFRFDWTLGNCSAPTWKLSLGVNLISYKSDTCFLCMIQTMKSEFYLKNET